MVQPASIFDTEDLDAEERALQEAEADLAAGRVVPHAEVVRWLESWGTLGELPPRPQPWKKELAVPQAPE